jgi:hypothetical protein
MKLLTLLLLLGLLLSAGACGAETTTYEPPIEPPTDALSSSEREIYAYCQEHIAELDDLVSGLERLVDEEIYDAGYVTGKMDTFVANYTRLHESWMATNNGDLAGGRVKRLERLWEDCLDNILLLETTIVTVYLDPDSVSDRDTENAGIALYEATENIKDIRVELDHVEETY